jgi:hypothetical protein
VKVKVFENNKLLKTFLVYKTGSNKYGNVMKVNDRSKSFINYMPGYEGDIGSVFTLNELFWQPYTVFNILPSEISSVTLENISDPSSSFSIGRVSDNYILSDLKTDITGWDTSRLRRYISYFTWIPFEQWAFDISGSEKNKIVAENPAFRIKVVKNDGQKISVTLWEKYTDNEGTIDSDRLWAKFENRDDLMIIRYFDIDPLLKKKGYFFHE